MSLERYYDDEARRVKKEIDSINARNRGAAASNAYDSAVQRIKNLYTGYNEGTLQWDSYDYALNFDNLEEAIRFKNKYGINYELVKYSYKKIDYKEDTTTETIESKTGNYKIDGAINENGYFGGDIKQETKVTEIKHYSLTVYSEINTYDQFVVMHWYEKPHKYSEQGISCFRFLSRFEGFFEANYKSLAKGHFYHPVLNYIFSIFFFFVSFALFFVSVYAHEPSLSIYIGSSSLLAMIISMGLFFQSRHRRVSYPAIHTTFMFIEMVNSALSFTILFLSVYYKSSFRDFTNFLISSWCIPLLLWILSLFFISDTFEEFHDDQKSMFESDAFEKYPYFKKHFKEIISSRRPEKPKMDIKTNKNAQSKSQVETPKEKTYFYIIHDIGKYDPNKIVANIIKTMNETPQFAFKAIKGKKEISLEAVRTLKKEYPEVVIYKYERK